MFPIVPEDLTGLTRDALVALSDGIRTAGKTIKHNAALSNGELPIDQADAVIKAHADQERIKARLSEIDAEQAEQDAQTAAAAAALEALSADDDDADGDAEDGDDATDEADAADEDGDDDDADEETTAAAAPATPAAVKTKAPAPRPTPKATTLATVSDKPIGRPDVLAATGQGRSAKKAGATYESWTELASDMLDTFPGLATGRQETLATIDANYGERQFTEDPIRNLEMTAAMCAPATPYYDLGCMNTTRRPIFNALPQFAAPRGAVSIYPSPTLEDITTGVGVWTHEDDANPSAEKSACQTIECADSETYRIYGVYRCLTVKNMSQLTFPELTAAYLNRLGAAHARLAEQQLLNAMGTAADLVIGRPLDYDGPVAVASQLAETLALHQEAQRWDVTNGWDIFLPRWVQTGIKVSLMRRRVTNGQGVRVPTDAEVNSIFTNVGFNPVWFIDTPTWAVSIPAVRNITNGNRLPDRVDAIIAPRGKFAVMDRGQLSVGVAANNIYRDNASNKRNEFTMFFENFEGLVDTDSCPAYKMRIPVCWNGVQIADITAPECDGTTSGS